MSTLWLLAHFDDEYLALPLILQRLRAGTPQRFLYLADYRTPALARRRLGETRAFLARFGIDPDAAVHAGAGSGALDGALVRSLPALWAAVEAHLPAEPPSELIVPAWEGGHPDHDACAALGVKLQAALPGRPVVRQFGLYNGKGVPGPLFRYAPLPENGPTERVRLAKADWLRWAAGVSAFPSQLHVWSTLWPALFAGCAARGFQVQTLDPARIGQRPHPGRLLYERTGRGSWEEVAERVAEFEPVPGSLRAVTGGA
jgi:LmbE family N-acetylglucosaminyl deacetylase